MQIKTIGIHLGKTACEVVAMDGCGKVVRRRRLWRRKPVAASCGAHRLACRLAALDHGVKLMPAQYVRPLVKTNKHDQADPRLRLCRAEGKQAIAEAGQRPEMRFLGFQTGLRALAANPRMPIKSAAQLDLQALHRARERLVTKRTARRSAPTSVVGAGNQIRAFLRERGSAVRSGRAALAKALP